MLKKLVPAVCILLCSVVALAQPAPAPTPEPQGALRVLVFVDSEPAEGVSLEIPKVGSARSNGEGSVELNGPAGVVTPVLGVPRALLPASATADGELRIALEAMTLVAHETVEVIGDS